MKTEIYGTIGPACEKPEILEEMFVSGMTGMRLNLSHGGLDTCGAWLEIIRQAAEKAKAVPKLLIDLQGPELRLGDLPERELLEGAWVQFVPVEEGREADPETIPVPAMAAEGLKKDQQVLIDDGKILLIVERGNLCRVIRGGVIKPRKSIALPGSGLYPPTLTKKDMENIRCIQEYGITGVMLPFVRNAEDIRNLRKALKDAGAEGTEVLAKIENRQGAEALEQLLPEADQIVIARGDLGNDMPLWELPGVQSRIAKACRKEGKPFMVVTQMLASMEERAVPTRAEVSDIFRAVAEGAKSVMLTGETAAGKYPAEAMAYMCNTVKAAERYLENTAT